MAQHHGPPEEVTLKQKTRSMAIRVASTRFLAVCPHSHLQLLPLKSSDETVVGCGSDIFWVIIRTMRRAEMPKTHQMQRAAPTSTPWSCNGFPELSSEDSGSSGAKVFLFIKQHWIKLIVDWHIQLRSSTHVQMAPSLASQNRVPN